jgi:hypothetical protein
VVTNNIRFPGAMPYENCLCVNIGGLCILCVPVWRPYFFLHCGCSGSLVSLLSFVSVADGVLITSLNVYEMACQMKGGLLVISLILICLLGSLNWTSFLAVPMAGDY